jgi:hypothetical protein
MTFRNCDRIDGTTIVSVKVREVLSQVTVMITDYDRARLLLKIGILFIRFGCWIAKIGYLDAD